MRPLESHSQPGFTLVELLLVIAIISMLMFVTLLALNPSKQLADARNAQRQSDVIVIINALHQYETEHVSVPAGIPYTTPMEICRSGLPVSSCNNAVRVDYLTGAYIADIPFDPLAPYTGTGTRYWVMREGAGGRFTVLAPYAERGKVIQSTR